MSFIYIQKPYSYLVYSENIQVVCVCVCVCVCVVHVSICVCIACNYLATKVFIGKLPPTG